jgi:predicted acyltransferase
MSSTDQANPVIRWTRRLEESSALDEAVGALEPKIRSAFGVGPRSSFLRGEWLGHALHPLLTDVVLGTWSSATVLDLTAGPESAAAAQRLVGTGLLAVAPTAWTGWAEWSAAEPREKRVGLVHAATNAVAIGSYAASYVARRQGRHQTGARLALAGVGVSMLGAYLGAHLAIARKVGSRNPAFAD